MSILYRFLGLIYGFVIAFSILVVIALFYILAPKHNRSIRRYWARFVLAICGIKLELIGEFDPKAQMLVLNHASILDIIALEAIHPANLCWLAKKEIKDLPVFGHIIKRPKMIAINRGNAREFIKTIEQAKERLSEGRVLAMFPEGTRGDGIRLKRFKSGANMLASKLNLNVQPVLIAGSRQAMSSKGGVSVKPFSKVVIKALDVMDELDFNALNASMQSQLNELNATYFAIATEASGDKNDTATAQPIEASDTVAQPTEASDTAAQPIEASDTAAQPIEASGDKVKHEPA